MPPSSNAFCTRAGKLLTGSLYDTPNCLQKRRSWRLNTGFIGPAFAHASTAPPERLNDGSGITSSASNSGSSPSPAHVGQAP